MTLKTYYDTLQVARTASSAVIRAAYRSLAQHHHPDRAADVTQATLSMQRLNEAYAVLSDPTRRAAYDEALALEEKRKAQIQPKDNYRPAGNTKSQPPSTSNPDEKTIWEIRDKSLQAATTSSTGARIVRDVRIWLVGVLVASTVLAIKLHGFESEVRPSIGAPNFNFEGLALNYVAATLILAFVSLLAVLCASVLPALHEHRWKVALAASVAITLFASWPSAA